MAQKLLGIDATTKLAVEVEGIQTSAGPGDAGKFAALDSTGRFSSTMMPVGVAPDVATFPASENLTAGDFINIWDDSGTWKARKADASASSAGKVAHGFILAAVTSGQTATVYFEGRNTQLSGLSPGLYALSHSTPGAVIALASGTTTAGHILQILGKATSATELNVEIADPIIRA